MKITSITLTPVSYPAPHPLRWGWGETPTMGSTIVQVHTDEGLVGLGDAGGPVGATGLLASQQAMLRDSLEPVLLGENPLDVTRLWAAMARRASGGWAGQLVGGIDVALWDIVGKAAGLPLYRLFGAYRDRVPCYIAPSMRQPEVLVEELAAYRAQGFRAAKLRIGLGPVGWAGGPRDQRRDIAILERGREVLGDDFAIGADTDRTYDHAMAARLAPVVHAVGLAWFEEPLLATEREQYVREMLRLREIIHVPLSGGQGFYGPLAFDELINRGAVDIVQPDAAIAGGLTPLRTVAAMAAGRGLLCMPHVSCNCGHDIRVMATAHALAALPNGAWLCYPAYDTPLRTELMQAPPVVRGGELILPERPGLGLALDPAALERLSRPG
jgi:D-galactarolactone cycloisomerase